MENKPRRSETQMPRLDLVLTKPPSRLNVHPDLGLFRTIKEGTQKLGAGYIFLPGELVGLEWRTDNSQKISFSDGYARGFYVPASYYPEDHIWPFWPEKKPEMHIATIHDPGKKQTKRRGDIDEWVEFVGRKLDDMFLK